jgi:hypothetical protein
MARLRRQRVSAPGRGRPDVRIPIALLLDADRRAIAALSESERALMRTVRAELGTASIGTRFDPRRVLLLKPGDVAGWAAARRAWIAERLAHDSRVDTATREGGKRCE